ncbi:hypothetical protein HGRIS_013889 [Hohenbuehelia grisea]|uniref:Uncharacterized protein n=1 Tax=Hohenbuehelia grisea TaxID=104357 RepID=A0ABR3IWV7_9AGAR
MAGVFTVVGLIVVAILGVIVTNIIRRRRAQKFDREIAEAAREAASAQAPAFLDDDPDDRGYGGAGGYGAKGGGMGYSDASSHGTYGQPAMGYESYGMNEFQPMGGYNAGGRGPMDNVSVVGAGAAGIGASALARARSQRNAGDDFAPGVGEGQSPYPAFAGPGGMQPEEAYYHTHQHPPMPPHHAAASYQTSRSPEHDLLDAAGLGVAPGVAAAAASSGADVSRMPSQHASSVSAYSSDLNRSRSQDARSFGYNSSIGSPPSSGTPGSGMSPPPPPQPQFNESYAAHYQPGFVPAGAPGAYQPDYVDHGARRVSAGEGAYAAYPGYTSSQGHGNDRGARPMSVSPLPNPFSPKPDDGYGGMAEASDDEDYEREHEGRRVLKVANE